MTKIYSVVDAYYSCYDPVQISIKEFEGNSETLYTYEELEKYSNFIAAKLASFDFKKGVHVGIWMGRSFELIAGLLAVAKFGGVYVPVDKKTPNSYANKIFKENDVEIIITDEGYIFGDCFKYVAETYEKNKLYESGCQNKKINLDDPVCILSTSGTTGNAKGVRLAHRSHIHLVRDTNYISITNKDIFIHYSSISFDAATFEIWGAILNGATLCIMPDGPFSLSDFEYVIKTGGVKTLWITSGLFSQVVDERITIFSNIETVLTGGDVVSSKHAYIFFKNYEGIRLLNCWGPTENSTFSTVKEFKGLEDISPMLPIGKAVRRTTIHILNNDEEIVGVGEEGRLFVTGAGLALDYYNSGEITENKFKKISIEGNLIRCFDTGDYGYFDGNDYHFLGRKDDVVKIRGHRIKLGEVEGKLEELDEIKRCVVIKNDDDNLGAYLDFHVQINDHLIKEIVRKKNTYWKEVYESAYSGKNIKKNQYIGWRDSRTGKNINRNAMNSWLVKIAEMLDRTKYCKVLELGCGTGLIYRVLKNKNINYTGVDNSIEGIEIFSKYADKKNINLYVSDIFDFIESKDLTKYDLIIINSVIQYLPSIKIIKELLSKLVNYSADSARIFVGDIPIPNTEIEASDKSIKIEPVEILNFLKSISESCAVLITHKKPPFLTEMEESRFDIDVRKNFISKMSSYSSCEYKNILNLDLKTPVVIKNIPKEELSESIIKSLQTKFKKGYYELIYEPDSKKGFLSLYIGDVKDIYSVYSDIVAERKSKDQKLNDVIPEEHKINKKIFEFIKLSLPEYMHPRKIYFYENLPITERGKTDKRELIRLSRNKLGSSINESNDNLIKAIRDILSSKDVEINDDSNLIDLGFDSLTIIKLIARIENAFIVDISIKDFFKNPTINYIKECISSKDVVIHNHAMEIAIENERYLENTQKNILFNEITSKNSFKYNIPILFNVIKKYSSEKCINIVERVIREYPELQSVISENGKYFDFKTINDVNHQVIDYSKISFKNNCKKFYTKPFNLKEDCPIRFAYFVNKKGYVVRILAVVHHIIMDGWSIKIFGDYLDALINKIGNPKKPISMTFRSIRRVDFSGNKMWWKSYLKNVPQSINLEGIKRRTSFSNTDNGKLINIKIAKEELSLLRESAAKSKTTLYIWILANISICLKYITKMEDFVIGSTYANRRSENEENQIGCLVNVYPFRINTERRKNFQSFLRMVRENFYNVLENQNLSLEQILNEISLERKGNQNPLFQVLYTYRNDANFSQNYSNYEFDIGLLGKMDFPVMSKFDLSFLVHEKADELIFGIEFKADLYEKYIIESILKDIKVNLVETCVNNKLIQNIPFKNYDRSQNNLDEFLSISREIEMIRGRRLNINASTTNSVGKTKYYKHIFNYRTSSKNLTEIHEGIFVYSFLVFIKRFTNSQNASIGYRTIVKNFPYLPISLSALPGAYKKKIIRISKMINKYESIFAFYGSYPELFVETIRDSKYINSEYDFTFCKSARSIDINSLIHINFNAKKGIAEIYISANAFAKGRANILYENLIELVGKIQNSKHQGLLSAPLLDEPILRKLYIEPSKKYSHNHFLDPFDQTVKNSPKKIALIGERKKYTYEELNIESNRFAHYLREKGVESGDCIALCLERSADLVIVILSLVKLGCIYVPIEPSFPLIRVNTILEVSMAKAIITEDSHVNDSIIKIKYLDFQNSKNRYSSANIDEKRSPKIDVYCIFTSGSTGAPKGVSINSFNILALLEWAKSEFPGSNLNRILFSTSVCFDLSIFEMFLPLYTGNTIVFTKSIVAENWQKYKPTLINTVPSAARGFIEFKLPIPESVEVIILAGEALQKKLAESLYDYSGKIKLYNIYGPTEDTVYSTFKYIKKDDKKITIGKPISGTNAFIVNENIELCPIGVLGELALSGNGLSKGYLNNNKLTSKKFITKKIYGKEIKLYLTGDVARYDENFEIEYHGRNDQQVKVRGYRIELEEIENIFLNSPHVKEAKAVVKKNSDRDVFIVLYLIPNNKNLLNSKTISNLGKEYLPSYMLPSKIIFLDEFPLNNNGKIDINLLPFELGDDKGQNEALHPDDFSDSLLSIWKRLTLADEINVKDNFFEVGGNSLMLIEILTFLEQQYEFTLSIAEFYEDPTIKGINEKYNDASVINTFAE